MKELGIFTKLAIGLGLLFLVYSFLSRIIPIYFFWESEIFCLIFLALGIIGLLWDGMRKRKALNKRTIWNKVGIGLICFIALIQVALMTMLPMTEAYKVSIEYIKDNDEIKSELGKVVDLQIIPSGGITIKRTLDNEMGSANIGFIVKGTRGYKKVRVRSSKQYKDIWKVTGIK
ncbi:cytochrome c oxidase assembly factor Coa1 family protein [Spongiimicrobium sp. 2-473A-2-J]|uniref:cytochrome c oxidase assembly factor Coa1 family protein n=1 Tax=Eudoraea algarum TaxID=3417568 RepID=UPI003D36BF49